MDHHFYELNIQELRRETPDAVSLVFEKHTAFSEYLAGQFLTLKIHLGGEEIRRAYSLCSSPLANEAPTVTVKKVDGGKMSTFLVDQLRQGQKLEVMPPIGNFVFRPHLTKKRWFMLFAAGSGITPLFSILKTVLLSEPQSYVSLLYGSRNESSILYHNELEEWVRRFPSRLKIVHTLSQPSENWFGETGRIDENCIMHHLEYLKPVSPFEETCVYMCGPQAMMDEVTTIVSSQGVARDHIYRESFTSGIDEATRQAAAETLEIKDRSVEIRLNGKVHQVLVPRGTTILDAALDKDLDMPYSCQSGLCTACRGKCLTGKVHMDEREGLSDEEMEEGYVLTCVGHPLTDGVVIEME